MAESVDRRSLLRGGLLAATGAAAGAAVGVAGGAALMHDASGRQGADGADGAATAAKFSDFGSQRVTATSGRQPGVETAPGAHAIYRACTLRRGCGADPRLADAADG
jgi:hypothetical protein